jgi:signal transduction histidine kinase
VNPGQPETYDAVLSGQPVFITSAPLPDLDWRLSIVVPLAEVTNQAQSVTRSIREDGSATVQKTLLIMAVLFMGAGMLSIVLTLRFITHPVQDLMDGVRSVTAGDLNITVPKVADDELGELADSFNQMAKKLQRRTDQLSAASSELQIKEAQLEVAALEERQRLARELHDSVSQALYGIALGARTAQAQLDSDSKKLAEPLAYIISLADAGLAEMRALIFELRPESLRKEGLVAALEKQAEAVEARNEIRIQTELGEEPNIPLDAKQALYRIAQEALQNTVKHAHASTVEIMLKWEGEGLVLAVRDDGDGFDPGREYPGHLGLQSMRERAEKIGGKIQITSQPGSGSLVRVTLPHS